VWLYNTTTYNSKTQLNNTEGYRSIFLLITDALLACTKSTCTRSFRGQQQNQIFSNICTSKNSEDTGQRIVPNEKVLNCSNLCYHAQVTNTLKVLLCTTLANCRYSF